MLTIFSMVVLVLGWLSLPLIWILFFRGKGEE